MKVSRWEIEADAQATRDAYETGPLGTGCDCEPCQNFERLARDAFSERIHEIFDALGIDYRKPAEIYHNCRLETGNHSYGGWYHFLGTIVFGEDCHQPTDDPGKSFSIETKAIPSPIK